MIGGGDWGMDVHCEAPLFFSVPRACTSRAPLSLHVSVPIPSAQIDKCFGFETSFTEAQAALMSAKVEARSNLDGIGLVKLMGRQSGFIAVQVRAAHEPRALFVHIRINQHGLCTLGPRALKNKRPWCQCSTNAHDRPRWTHD